MEGATDGDVPDNRSGIGYLEALKIVALPMGSIVSVVALVFFFAAESWVRGIAQEELAGGATMATAHSTKLTEHEGLLAQHDEEIEDNEDEIDEVDDKFTEFVRDVIDRL